jgi:hypothetical protein
MNTVLLKQTMGHKNPTGGSPFGILTPREIGCALCPKKKKPKIAPTDFRDDDASRPTVRGERLLGVIFISSEHQHFPMESSSSEPDNDGKELFGLPKLANKKALKLSLQGVDVSAMLQYGRAFTKQFICDLPPLRLVDASGTPRVVDEDTEEDQISCKSISTYPMLGDGRFVVVEAQRSPPFRDSLGADFFSKNNSKEIALQPSSIFFLYLFAHFRQSRWRPNCGPFQSAAFQESGLDRFG